LVLHLYHLFGCFCSAKFEAELTSQNDVTYSIVHPTAFFKSVSGQLEGIQRGAPYVLFGKGDVTRCNPIAKEDLAYFMMDSAVNKEKLNKIMNIGGPDGPLTNQMLAEVSKQSLALCGQLDFVVALSRNFMGQLWNMQ
jgi:divinyl chlorophyllide a 8-vinyl-reductase